MNIQCCRFPDRILQCLFQTLAFTHYGIQTFADFFFAGCLELVAFFLKGLQFCVALTFYAQNFCVD